MQLFTPKTSPDTLSDTQCFRYSVTMCTSEYIKFITMYDRNHYDNLLQNYIDYSHFEHTILLCNHIDEQKEWKISKKWEGKGNFKKDQEYENSSFKIIQACKNSWLFSW